MRRTRGALALIVCAALAGCFTQPDGSRWKARSPEGGPSVARSLAPNPLAADGLYLDVVLIERPVGDPVLEREVWGSARPVGTEELQVLFTENALRAAILGGNLPPGFLKLLITEADTVNPRRLTFGTRKEEVVPTVGPTDPCEYDVLTDLAAKRTRVKLRQARAGIQIRPEAAPGGRIKVTCEPQLQHGDRQDWIRPTADVTGFTVQAEVPLERYPTLTFEATLGPGEYLVIGAPGAGIGTLGDALFGLEVNNRPRQRVLVVRAGRNGEAPAEFPTVPNLRRPSIAAEASRP